MPTFKNHMQFIALPRTGHHAVMDWVENHLDSFEHQGPLWDKGCTEKLQPLLPTVRVHAPEPDKDVDWYIWTCECSAVGFLLNYLKPLKVDGRKEIVLVVRSLKNWLASFSQWSINSCGQMPTEDQVHQMVTLWLDHSVWALHGGLKVNVIVYDKWFTDARYREDLSVELGIYTEEGFKRAETMRHRTSTAGGGSSFDGMEYDGEATQMNVLNRWEDLDDTTVLQEVLDKRLDVQLLDEALACV